MKNERDVATTAVDEGSLTSEDSAAELANKQSFWHRHGRTIAGVVAGGVLAFVAYRLLKNRFGAANAAPLTLNSPAAGCNAQPIVPPAPASPSVFRLESSAKCVDKKLLRQGKWSSNIASESISCGEDSFFISAAAFGVADGVGGWARHGISAKEFSQALVDGAVAEARKEESSGQRTNMDPRVILDAADAKAKKRVRAGSSTACFGTVSDSGLLRVANVGDSSLVVVRGPSIVFQAEETNHGFNYPKQLGVFPNGGRSDTVDDAWTGSFQLAPDDVIIAATDGVFDNVRPQDLARIAYHTVGSGRQKSTSPSVSLAATDVVTKACKEALSENGAWGGSASGVGGKPDDITAVVLRAVLRPSN